MKKAQQVFRDVLTGDPDNKHAHYCLGMIELYVGHYPDAYPHFKRVSELDPDDAHTWLWLGTTHPSGRESAEAAESYEKALKLDPHLNEARYRLMRAIIDNDSERAHDLMTEHLKLQESDQVTPSRIVFGEMGKYADVIGRDPNKPGQPGGDPPGIVKRHGW